MPRQIDGNGPVLYPPMVDDEPLPPPPPEGTVTRDPYYNTPIYTPPPVDEGMVWDPNKPQPHFSEPRPFTADDYRELHGRDPDPADANLNGRVSRAEDEFHNGSPPPFEQPDASAALDPWTHERYT